MTVAEPRRLTADEFIAWASRDNGGRLETVILHEGALRLDPPGLESALEVVCRGV